MLKSESLVNNAVVSVRFSKNCVQKKGNADLDFREHAERGETIVWELE